MNDELHIVQRLRAAGCKCESPLIGQRPPNLYRCRLCNVEEKSIKHSLAEWMKSKRLDRTSGFTKDFLKWKEDTGVQELTTSQHYFVEWLLENSEFVGQLVATEELYGSVRTWIKEQ